MDTQKCSSKATCGIRTNRKTKRTQEQAANPFKHEPLPATPSRPIKIRSQLRPHEERAWPSQTLSRLSRGQPTSTAAMKETKALLRRDQRPSSQLWPSPEPLVPQMSNSSATNRTGSAKHPDEYPPLKKQTHCLRTTNILDQDMKQESKR